MAFWRCIPLLKMGIFYCHVSLPEGSWYQPNTKNTSPVFDSSVRVWPPSVRNVQMAHLGFVAKPRWGTLHLVHVWSISLEVQSTHHFSIGLVHRFHFLIVMNVFFKKGTTKILKWWQRLPRFFSYRTHATGWEYPTKSVGVGRNGSAVKHQKGWTFVKSGAPLKPSASEMGRGIRMCVRCLVKL